MAQHVISYQVLPKDLHAHLFEVSCTILHPHRDGQRLTMPSWIPGSYLIREFAKNVIQIHASDKNGAVAVTKIDKDTWQADHASSPLTVTYQVYAFDPSIRAAYLDQWHGFFNGTSLFMRPTGFEDAEFEVEILEPVQKPHRDWRIATTLPAKQVDGRGFGLYQVDSYEALVDHPVLLDDFREVNFDACGTPHQVAFSGRSEQADIDRVSRDLAKICASHIRFFGEPAPFARYLFIVKLEEEGYGGLEHQSSTVLLTKTSDLPQSGAPDMSHGYRAFLGLCSHEYFHAWNVKRIKPESFLPYDLNKESYTKLLWLFEGITSYYDDLALLRSGVISLPSFLELLGRNITRVYRYTGRQKQTLEQSSFDTWIKFYRQDENSPNTTVSYYTKGSLVALLLDLTLRLETGNKTSLDDVMRSLWQEYGKKQTGLPEESFEKLVHKIAGVSLKEFFDTALRSYQELPLAETLQAFGIACHFRAQEHERDEGGISHKKADEPVSLPYIGAKLKKDDHQITVIHAYDDGPFLGAGIWAGDEILAIGGVRATAHNVEGLINHLHPHQNTKVLAARRGYVFEADVKITTRPHTTCYLTPAQTTDERAKQLRDTWLLDSRSEP